MSYQYQIHVEEQGRPFPHYWELCVGSCHAATLLRADVQAQIRRAHEEIGFQYIRFHGLLDDDMSVVMAPLMPGARPQFSFFNIDRVFDFLQSIGMKPFVELGFMPEYFASTSQTTFHYKGYSSMPKNDSDWKELITRLAAHLEDRYGTAEVRSWFFEVWNEPNMRFFFDGSMKDYFHLYEITAKSLKSVDEALRVGGPASSNNMWIPELRKFCKDHAVPLDFISTHHYPSDDPLSMAGINGADEKGETLTEKFAKLPKEELDKAVKAFFHRENKNPRDVLYRMAKKAKEEAGDLPLYYTEWNVGHYDTSYAAAGIVMTLSYNEGLVDGYSYWCVSDIFEENGLHGLPFNNEFGLVNVYGIRKPSYRVFQLLHQAGDRRLSVKEGDTAAAAAARDSEAEAAAGSDVGSGVSSAASSDVVSGVRSAVGSDVVSDAGSAVDRTAAGIPETAHKTAEVLALSDDKTNTAMIFVYNHDIEERDIKAEEIELTLTGKIRKIRKTVIDKDHMNPLSVWEAQGKPVYPTNRQLAELEAETCPVWTSVPAAAQGQDTLIRFTALPESVTVFEIVK